MIPENLVELRSAYLTQRQIIADLKAQVLDLKDLNNELMAARNCKRDECNRANAKIAALEEEADWTDLFDALQRSGIDMANAGTGRNPIEGIEMLASERDAWKAKAIEERKTLIMRRKLALHNPFDPEISEDEAMHEAVRELEEEMREDDKP